jgi:putative FmdB family regulatory protein
VPLYEYQCRKCRRRTERIERLSGPSLKKCPHCGATVDRMQSAPAIQFKGSGWYATDYAKKSGTPEGAKPEKPSGEAAAASGDAAAASSAAKGKESPAKEKKPAEKK